MEERDRRKGRKLRKEGRGREGGTRNDGAKKSLTGLDGRSWTKEKSTKGGRVLREREVRFSISRCPGTYYDVYEHFITDEFN